jgi:hypothetical protein
VCNLDTTRLQPVVLQLRSYKPALNARETPPGFSRWYFNLRATIQGC